MNQPHGGVLVNRIATGARKEELEAKAKTIFNLTVEDRYGADIEMIAVGAFITLSRRRIGTRRITPRSRVRIRATTHTT